MTEVIDGSINPECLQFYNIKSPNFSVRPMKIYIFVECTEGHTSMAVVGLHADRHYYVLDIVHDCFNAKQRAESIVSLCMKWTERSGRNPIVACQESLLTSDRGIIDTAMDSLNYRFIIDPLCGLPDKAERVGKLINDFQDRLFFFPRTIMYKPLAGAEIDFIDQFVEKEYGGLPDSIEGGFILNILSCLYDQDIDIQFPGVTAYGDILGKSCNEKEYLAW